MAVQGVIAKALLSLMPKDSLIKIIILAALIPVFLFILFFSTPLLIYKKIPLAPYGSVQNYVIAARVASEYTRTEIDKEGLKVDWQQVIAIDTVLLNQDFSKSNLLNANKIAMMFIKKIGSKTIKKGDKSISVPIYKILTVDEVIDKLINTGVMIEEDRDKIHKLLENDFSFIAEETGLDGYVGAEAPDETWQPVEKDFTWPVVNYHTVTSTFGWRIHPLLHTRRFHTGIDIGAPVGAKIIAPKDGTVTKVVTDDSVYGYSLIVDHGNGIRSFYGHVDNFGPGINEGVKILRGQIIAYVGERGWSKGPHLHFEVRHNNQQVNPINFY